MMAATVVKQKKNCCQFTIWFLIVVGVILLCIYLSDAMHHNSMRMIRVPKEEHIQQHKPDAKVLKSNASNSSIFPEIRTRDRLRNRQKHIDIFRHKFNDINKAVNINTNYSNHNGPCDYVNIKGIPKSGTTWLEFGVIPIIAQKSCKILNITLNLCKKDHIGHWTKHDTTLPLNDQIGAWYTNQTSIDTNQPVRICAITTFRDPRDRIISWAYYHYRGPHAHDFAVVNNNVRKDFPNALKDLKNWWDFYHIQARLNGKYGRYLFFDSFYEDLVLNPKKTIMDMTQFIGVKEILMQNKNESVIDEIVHEIEWDYLKKININTYRSKRNNGTKNVCNFQKFISNETVEFINQQIIKAELPEELIYEWNSMCPFDQKVLDHYIN